MKTVFSFNVVPITRDTWPAVGVFGYAFIILHATASIRAYPGLSCEEDVGIFVAASRQLCSGLNKACGKAETFAFLGASLMVVERLKIHVWTLCDLNGSPYAQNGD